MEKKNKENEKKSRTSAVQQDYAIDKVWLAKLRIRLKICGKSTEQFPMNQDLPWIPRGPQGGPLDIAQFCLLYTSETHLEKSFLILPIQV